MRPGESRAALTSAGGSLPFRALRRPLRLKPGPEPRENRHRLAQRRHGAPQPAIACQPTGSVTPMAVYSRYFLGISSIIDSPIALPMRVNQIALPR